MLRKLIPLKRYLVYVAQALLLAWIFVPALEGAPPRKRTAPRNKKHRLSPKTPQKALPSFVPTLDRQAPGVWYLKGGQITGAYIQGAQQADWPLWAQALCAQRSGVGTQELAKADLGKIPDVWLSQALDRLRISQVFTPKLVAQCTRIDHIAQAAPWVRARTAYQSAYLKARPLPLEDPGACSKLLTDLVKEGEGKLVRSILQQGLWPQDPALRASFQRMLDMEEGRLLPSESMIRDARIPHAERYHAFRKRRPFSASLLPALKGSSFFDEAVLYCLEKQQLELTHPLVDAAIQGTPPQNTALPAESETWFMHRPGEKASDLLWMRIVYGLSKGDTPSTVTSAQDLLQRFPHSFFAPLAEYLLEGLGVTPTARAQRLRLPADITIGSTVTLLTTSLKRPSLPWPQKFQSWAKQGRYDLMVFHGDPEAENQIWLQAALAAGQMDLVARHFVLHQDLSPDTLPFLYPTLPAPLLARIIREEGAESVLDEAFVMAILKNESQWQPSAQSGARAMGLMQLLQPTFRSMMGRSSNIWDPESNLRAGIRYFKRVAHQAHLSGEPPLVRMLYLAAGYHAGEGRAKRWHADMRERLGSSTKAQDILLRAEAIPFRSTRHYALRVLGDQWFFSRLLTQEAGVDRGPRRPM